MNNDRVGQKMSNFEKLV